jgi:hypothetical protein
VSGHLQAGTDARQMWGANGFPQSRPLHSVAGAITSVVEGTLNKVVEHTGIRTVAGVISGMVTAKSNGSLQSGASPIPGASETPAQAAAPAVGGSGKETVSAPSAAEERDRNKGESDKKEEKEKQDQDQDQEQEQDEQLLSEWEDLNPAALQGWWRATVSKGEEFLLNWEPTALEQLNDSLRKILVDHLYGKIKGMAKGEILKVRFCSRSHLV